MNQRWKTQQRKDQQSSKVSFSNKTNNMTSFSKNGLKEKTEFKNIGYEELSENMNTENSNHAILAILTIIGQ